MDDGEPIPVEVLRAVVAAVHAVGGRVAVHAQQPAGSAVAVAAQVDSLEHGMGLDPALLTQMAAQGTALTPTLTVINGSLARVLARPDGPKKAWYVGGASVHAQLCAAAAEAGVSILAGTDSRPTGKIAGEIRALAAAGIRPHDALAAGSWAARAYLGIPGLAEGAPADAVVYDSDPRADLAQLDHPRAVILRGRLVLRRRASRNQPKPARQRAT
jgi:imidazolonepropionase-like amidohydrolase